MTFLKTLKIFSQETTDFEVHIIGDGSLRKKMERFMEKAGLSPNVKFLGKIAEEKMVEEYQSAHVMIAPSLNEGMSISALEALSCGVYLIATRASGFEEMIKEGVNGEFVNFRDTKDLSGRLTEFYFQYRGKKPVPETDLRQISNTLNWRSISQNYLAQFNFILNDSE